ncbi:hypothetical protein [Xanthocytophaga agilis]|uniref:Uncharacterized protein n=1 Tax=Xanthocytophaga agilis TaxID=3048010 RepID=A0AAE3R9G8_9BACT|nr:hypothetical protein [Xanthocytophaga agilis]MDJ1506366.1 hypothetical protein [Xanthocytophaga agilis]
MNKNDLEVHFAISQKVNKIYATNKRATGAPIISDPKSFNLDREPLKRNNIQPAKIFATIKILILFEVDSGFTYIQVT